MAFLPNIIRMILRRMRWADHVARIGEIRNVYEIFLGELEGKRPFGGVGRIFEDNIKMDLKAMGCDGVDWFHLTQDRVF
jgi:hypothetical protein